MKFSKTDDGYVRFVHQPFAFKWVYIHPQAIKGYHLFKVVVINTRDDENTYYFDYFDIYDLVSLMNDSYTHIGDCYEIR